MEIVPHYTFTVLKRKATAPLLEIVNAILAKMKGVAAGAVIRNRTVPSKGSKLTIWLPLLSQVVARGHFPNCPVSNVAAVIHLYQGEWGSGILGQNGEGAKMSTSLWRISRGCPWSCLNRWQEPEWSTVRGDYRRFDRADIAENLFLNTDAGFDSKDFRSVYATRDIMPTNVSKNILAEWMKGQIYWSGSLWQRYTVKRTNVWTDSFRSLFIRCDTTIEGSERGQLLIIHSNGIEKIKSRKFKLVHVEIPCCESISFLDQQIFIGCFVKLP